jgi:uroporphyrinogen decarboxylase
LLTDPKTPSHPSVDSPFMKACRREPVPYTPIWLMRQAGRYMKEYREVRARVSMLELCKSPELVSEVTVYAATRLGVDAAILFADLLLMVESFGLKLEYLKNEGPKITPPVRTREDVDKLPEVDSESLAYVYDAVTQTRADLPSGIPLIGFGGAPFTMASYLIEGGGTRSFENVKRFMYQDEGAWNELMSKIVRGHIGYLNRQVEAGAQAIQIFDSWVGTLSPYDYRRYVMPHSAALIASIQPGVPVIHFGTGTATLLPDMKEAGGDVIGLDWRVELDQEWERLGSGVAVQGNLDPLVFFGGKTVIEEQADRVLAQAAGRPGHIFNIGHGILPSTPVDNVVHLVEHVHEKSRR